jgi:cytidyltransferase-like protein
MSLTKKKVFNWKSPTAVFIGRFQPFHDGHKKLFINALKKNKQVTILVMDSYKINNKNPFKFHFVKKKIIESLKKYVGKFIIIKIPVVSEVVYGRKVGYKIRKVSLSKKIQKISATNIRKNLLKNA